MAFVSGIWRAGRQFLKAPGFSAAVVATLALCIGANTAIYSLVDAVFFRSLPYPNPGRLVMLSTAYRQGSKSDLDTGQTGRQWELVRDGATYLDAAVYSDDNPGVNLFAAGHAAYVKQQRVSAGFFRVLGIKPLLGREFSRSEDVRGGPALAVLSYGLWQRAFQSDRMMVGRSIDLRGAPYTVIGVMPAGFRTDKPVDVWTPLQPSTRGEGGGSNYAVVGRLKDGATNVQANGQLEVIFKTLFADWHLPPGTSAREEIVPLQRAETLDMRSSVQLMWGAAGLVLLIGCINVAGLLLARSSARSREVATRMALGASRQRVISQLLTEAALLAGIGGVLGIVIGWFGLRAITLLNPDQFDLWGPPRLDFHVLAIMVCISLLTSIIFGLAPAFEASGVDIRTALSEAGRSISGSRRRWKRQVLVFAEVALSVMLLAAAGLVIRTFAGLLSLDPGFNPNHIETASLSLQDAHYATAAACDRLFRETLQRIRQIPGVESADIALTLPYERPLNEGVGRINGGPVATEPNITNFTYVTPGALETLRVPLLQGRKFTETDNAHSAKVAVVNNAFIKKFLPHTPDPLGTMVEIEGGNFQIVGVVRDVAQRNGWGSEYGILAPLAQVYVPNGQLADAFFPGVHIWFSPSWIVRTRGEVKGLPDQMSRALADVDPRLTFAKFRSMPDVRAQSLGQQRYHAILFGSFAALALLLAGLGIYGLIAQTVAQRTREMGIRMALGASVKNVVQTVVAPGLMLSLGGVAAGLLLAAFLTQLMKSIIWGVTATDPLTFAGGAILLVAVAFVSSLIPALRLTRLDPAQTLRDE